MTDKTRERYRKFRKQHPLMSASYCLTWAKREPAGDKWESDGHDENYKREVEGFTIKLKVEQESIYPIPNKHGDTDYGKYVDERGSQRWGWDGEWAGNWPEPQEHAEFVTTEKTPSGIRHRTIRLPYTSIRYSGPGWVQGEGTGYFIPDGMDEQYDAYRRQGQSRQVAWDMTKEWVESQLEMLFSSPLTQCVVFVKAYKEGIELGATVMGTDVSGDDEGRDYIFEMVDDHGMIEEVIEEAKENIGKLTEV